MTHKKHSATAFFGNVLHLAETFLLKLGVAYRQNLVDDQNLRFKTRGDGKGQSHIHSA